MSRERRERFDPHLTKWDDGGRTKQSDMSYMSNQIKMRDVWMRRCILCTYVFWEPVSENMHPTDG